MSNVIEIKGKREAPKAARSSMETLIISVDQVNQWKIPPFQRPLRVNSKVEGIAKEIRESGCEITGVITLGRVAKDPAMWIVDGQHRLEAFRISAVPEVIADVRIVSFDTMADMSEEFVRLNQHLVVMRPDDILRGLEPTTSSLRLIRKECDFVGYTHIRRNGVSGPILSMAAAIRAWTASTAETPASNAGGSSVSAMAAHMDDENAHNLVRFLQLAQAAWGRDREYHRLWAGVNLTLCMWLWRRLVLDRHRAATKRVIVISAAQFKQCLMSVSADKDYVDWLPGRTLSDRDRSPAYGRLKKIFVQRLRAESGDAKKAFLPQPAWSSN